MKRLNTLRDALEMRAAYDKLINKIKKETQAPLCASYEYDLTPTAEERLKNIQKMITDFKSS